MPDAGFAGTGAREVRASPKCFLHIPKSGGSSVLAALEAKLGPHSLAPRRADNSIFCDFRDFDVLSPAARAQLAVTDAEVRSLGRFAAVGGHFSLPTLLQLADFSSICTVLREPRARLLSLYAFWRIPGIGDPLLPYRVTMHALQPLWRFLSETRLAPVVDNQICRMLLYGDPRLPHSGFAAERDIESIARDAIERLDALGFVGVLELGDSAWCGIGQLFDLVLVPLELNVTGQLERPTRARPGEELIAGGALELLEQRSAADLVVYDYALERAGLASLERMRVIDSALQRQLAKTEALIRAPGAGVYDIAGVPPERRGTRHGTTRRSVLQRSLDPHSPSLGSDGD